MAIAKRKRSFDLFLLIILISCVLVGWFFLKSADDEKNRTRVAAALNVAQAAEALIRAFQTMHAIWPTNNFDIGLTERHFENLSQISDIDHPGTVDFSIVLSQKILVLRFAADQDQLANKTLIFRPLGDSVFAQWSCTEGTVDSRYRPMACRKN